MDVTPAHTQGMAPSPPYAPPAGKCSVRYRVNNE
jgi:hypothetical protein